MKHVTSLLVNSGVFNEYYKGDYAPGKDTYRRLDPLLLQYQYDITPLPLDYSVRSRSYMTVEKDGEYWFRTRNPGRDKITVAGKIVQGGAPVAAPDKAPGVFLKAGSPVELEIDFYVCAGMNCRILEVFVKDSAGQEQTLPESWLAPRMSKGQQKWVPVP
jgi:hypothetical protein